MNQTEIERRFTTQPLPTEDKIQKYMQVRDFGKTYAELLVKLCPESRELSLAITKLEEAVFWANDAIARNE